MSREMLVHKRYRPTSLGWVSSCRADKSIELMTRDGLSMACRMNGAFTHAKSQLAPYFRQVSHD